MAGSLERCTRRCEAATDSGRSRLFLGLWLGLSLALGLGAGEAVVRWQGVWNLDGTFFFRGRPVRPFALPVQTARQAVEQYRHSSSSFVVYDPELGWSHRPNASTADGLHRTNAAGLRADRNYAAALRPGQFRVSMFGDSFILGSDVAQADAPGAQLERLLTARGLDAEVLNFGVGGYGIDQAFLRYRRDGARYDTTVVVQGLQLENIGRDVTLFRIVAVPGTAIPFSKPRFVVRNGALALANQPAVPVEDVVATLAGFPEWPLARYEGSYAERYQRHWYNPSLLVSTAIELWKTRHGDQTPDASTLYDPAGEGLDVTVRLLETYRDEAARAGTPFLLVYLPRADTIHALLAAQPDPWQAHLDRLRGFTIVDPSPALVRYAREHGTAALIPGHYSVAGYRIVAEALAAALVPLAPRPDGAPAR